MRAARRGALAAAIVTASLVPVTPALAFSVHVEGRVATRHAVRVSFRAPKLPAGGYYYAVLVLRPYKSYSRSLPPPCSVSSDMYRTEYGYPRAGARVALTLTSGQSRTGHWCLGGTYEGGVYAVPHEPPCPQGTYPCYYKEPVPQCFTVGGKLACGIVLPRRWRYPEGLPAPQASGTRIVARFTIRFSS